MNKELIIGVLVLSLIFVSELSFAQTTTKRWPVTNNYHSVKSNANAYTNVYQNQYPIAQQINWQANFVAANYNPYVMQQQMNNMISRFAQPRISFSNYQNTTSMLAPRFNIPGFNIIPMMMTPPMMAHHYGQTGFANAPFFPSMGMHY